MRRRDLSPDEALLWGEVAKSVKPIRRPAKKSAKKPASAKPVEAAPTKPPAARRHATAPAAATPKPSAPRAPASRPPSAFDAGDPKLDRKARRGQLAAERTLDLHGLTQDAAAVRLRSFLQKASADGLKCVRVITGKGARAGGASGERGVLRRRFLDWVDTAPNRGLIARVAPAEPGARAGAFFVFLKSQRGA